MPRKTKTVETSVAVAETPVSETVTLSKAELNALIAQSVQAQLEAHTKASTAGTPIAEAFAESMKSVLERSDEKTKALVDGVLTKTGPRENTISENPRISVFNPLGERDHPLPKLQDRTGNPRVTYFNGLPMQDFTTLTRDEIEALNALHDDVDIEKPGGTWTVRVKKNGTREECHITLPMTDRDTYLHFPSLLSVLQELRFGKKALNLNTLFAKMVANSTDPDAFIAALQKLADGKSADAAA